MKLFRKIRLVSNQNSPEDINELIESYVNRFQGTVDFNRLILNLIADGITDIKTIKAYLIAEEYKILKKENKNRDEVILELSKRYGTSRTRIEKVLEDWISKFNGGLS